MPSVATSMAMRTTFGSSTNLWSSSRKHEGQYIRMSAVTPIDWDAESYLVLSQIERPKSSFGFVIAERSSRLERQRDAG